MPRFDVTIAGEVNLDLILYGVPEELPCERELLADSVMLTLGGSSAILAHNLAALGSRVRVRSRIGDDNLGEVALHPLQQNGADVSRVRHTHPRSEDGHYCDFAARAMAQHGDLCGNNRRAWVG
jgi:sugar/nucleoside kinase (ribokinase family)